MKYRHTHSSNTALLDHLDTVRVCSSSVLFNVAEPADKATSGGLVDFSDAIYFGIRSKLDCVDVTGVIVVTKLGDVYFCKDEKCLVSMNNYAPEDHGTFYLVGNLTRVEPAPDSANEHLPHLSEMDFWCFRGVLSYPNDGVVPYQYRYTHQRSGKWATGEEQIKPVSQLICFLVNRGFLDKLLLADLSQEATNQVQ